MDLEVSGELLTEKRKTCERFMVILRLDLGTNLRLHLPPPAFLRHNIIEAMGRRFARRRVAEQGELGAKQVVFYDTSLCR